ncbi:HTH domain-containing protein [Treponema denticola]|uniref:Mu transposase C-terminal domain-containing protein n=1 Tax=Treponema denticola TaxID=158 RepID=UPI003D6F948A
MASLTQAVFQGNKKHREKVAVFEAWQTRRPGLTVRMAEEELSDRFGLSVSTVRRYIKEIRENGYLPVEKPKQGRSVFAWDNEALSFLKAFYLAVQRDVGYCTVRNAYNQTCKVALEKGWAVGSEPSAYKHLKTLSTLLIDYTQGGRRALDNLFYIARDLSTLKPFEVVVGDQHRFNFWVVDSKGKKFRPECYAWLDMRTRLPYGVSFEAGPYNFRTVARALRQGLIRFGKFGSTYNDNGKPETAKKIDWLVEALQTFGMKFTDEAELFKTEDGHYALEDESGAVIAMADTCEVWHKKNRRIFARVKNAKTKPIERFFSTFEQLLLDRFLPGYVRNIKASAAEDEEATRRLNWQEANGYLLHYEEFVEQANLALETYEQRLHSSLKHSPRDEMMKAIENEGWEPSRIKLEDIKALFMEPDHRIVRNNRITISGINYVGPNLTSEMVSQNRNNLAGLQGQRIEVRFDPDDPSSGVYAIHPVTGEAIFLTPEKRIDFFDEKAVAAAIEEKNANIRAVSESYSKAIKGFGKVITSSRYKNLEQGKKISNENEAKFLPDPELTDSDFAQAVGERLTIVINASQNRQSVYSSERDRFDAILDAVMDGAVLSEADQAFKLKYEKNMSEDERLFFETKINLGLEARKEKTKWH